MKEFGTKKGLFKPIEFKVNGVEYKLDHLTADEYAKVADLDDVVGTGDVTALIKQVSMLSTVPLKVMNKMDVREINNLKAFLVAEIRTPEKYLKGTEKKK